MTENNLNGQSLNILQENISALRQLFPEVCCEDKVDFNKLKQLLGEYVDDSKERYSFTWNGKGKALRLSQTPSLGTLRPYPEEEESKNWDTTQNMYIEGDNLEVLKLLQKSYHGKIKMIYIDPPYNTGGDFVYPDDFSDSIENYKRITGQVDDEGRKLGTNSEANGRYHTDWLNMMYPRLRLARNLLTDNGIIFISADDNEIGNLYKLCCEVFGDANFVANFIWEKRKTRENRKIISVRHDYVLCFVKNYEFRSEAIGLDIMTEDAIERYKNPDNDSRGVWTSVPAIAQAGHGTKSQFYTLTTPNGRKVDPPSGSCWRYTQTKMEEAIADNRIWFGSDGNGVPRIKKFLTEGKQGLTPETLLFADNVGTNDSGKRELVSLFDEIAAFETPKPSTLIKYLQQICNDSSDAIILDFFSGSATTAHAVMKLNAEDGGNRKFICVQLPEPCAEGTEAAKAGYKTICEIGKERIRRAGEKIKAEVEEQNAQIMLGEEPKQVPDIGFKVFKLDNSNLKKWSDAGAYIQNEKGELEFDMDKFQTILKDTVGNFLDGRSELDVVYEIMLKMGLDLTYPLEQHSFEGKNVYSVGFGALMICLDDNITASVAEGMVSLYQELAPNVWKAVFKDNGFASDSAKTNIKEILKCAGLEEDAFITI